MTKTKKEKQKSDILKITGMCLATLLGIVALIGGFWGAEGFRKIGLTISIGIVILIFWTILVE